MPNRIEKHHTITTVGELMDALSRFTPDTPVHGVCYMDAYEGLVLNPLCLVETNEGCVLCAETDRKTAEVHQENAFYTEDDYV